MDPHVGLIVVVTGREDHGHGVAGLVKVDLARQLISKNVFRFDRITIKELH